MKKALASPSWIVHSNAMETNKLIKGLRVRIVRRVNPDGSPREFADGIYVVGARTGQGNVRLKRESDGKRELVCIRGDSTLQLIPA